MQDIKSQHAVINTWLLLPIVNIVYGITDVFRDDFA